MKKEELLQKLRANAPEPVEKPVIDIDAITYPNVVEAFVDMTKQVGGNVVFVKKGDDLNALIKEQYPEAKVFASNVEGIAIAQKNPDEVKEAAELDGTDVGIIKGEIGVAENGCIWVPQTMKEKAICFISEDIIILLDKSKIVNNMHEAYRKITFTDYQFGTFISGPSKTADIEQALVVGAQAARSVTVMILED